MLDFRSSSRLPHTPRAAMPQVTLALVFDTSRLKLAAPVRDPVDDRKLGPSAIKAWKIIATSKKDGTPQKEYFLVAIADRMRQWHKARFERGGNVMFKNLTLTTYRNFAVCILAAASLTIVLASNLIAADQPPGPNPTIEADTGPAISGKEFVAQRPDLSAQKRARMSLALLIPHKNITPRKSPNLHKAACWPTGTRCSRDDQCCDPYICEFNVCW